MLHKLVLNNFQSHKHTEVEFSDDVTAIVGLNNHGKSAIFRSMQKCIRNIPDGNIFITDTPKQEAECLITVYSDNGVVTRKVRNDNASDANSYIIAPEEIDGNPEVYTKFGRTGIPEEIIKCLPTDSPITFGDVEIDLNFQNQIDELFLMQGSGLPALRGKVLGRSTGVDNVQRAIQICASEEKKLKADLKNLTADINNLNIKLLKYSNVDSLLNSITICNNLLEDIENKRKLKETYQNSLNTIKTIVDKASSLKERINKMQIPSLAEVSYMREAHVKFLLAITTRDTLSRYNITNKKVQDLSYIVQIQEYFEYIKGKATLFGTIQKLLVFWSNLKVTEEIVLRLRSSLDDIQKWYQLLLTSFSNLYTLSEKQEQLDIDELRSGNLHLYIEGTDKDISEVVSELEAYKKEIKVCPTCGKAW